jgi:hypothetical protein
MVPIRELRPGETMEMSANASVPNFRDWRDGGTTLSSKAAMGVRASNVTGVDFPEEIQVAVGTPNLLEVLRIQPAEGRGFRPEEGASGTGDVVVITDRYRDRRYDEGADVLGRPLTLDGVQYTIVGVMPEGFEMLPAGVHAFRPSDLLEEGDRGAKGWLVFGRLRPGTTEERAQGELVAVGMAVRAPLAFLVHRGVLLSLNLFGAEPGPSTGLLAVLILGAVAAMATFLPARNASKAQPTKALSLE